MKELCIHDVVMHFSLLIYNNTTNTKITSSCIKHLNVSHASYSSNFYHKIHYSCASVTEMSQTPKPILQNVYGQKSASSEKKDWLLFEMNTYNFKFSSLPPFPIVASRLKLMLCQVSCGWLVLLQVQPDSRTWCLVLSTLVRQSSL